MNYRDKAALLNFSDSQKRLMKLLGVFLIILITIILIVFIIKLFVGNKVSYEQLENITVRATEAYVANSDDILGSEVYGTTEVPISTLINKGYMKEMNKYVGDDVSCTGKVLVYKNLDQYTYIPKINCGEDYSAKSLADVITADKNIVTSGGGLYSEVDKYVYRGEIVDNYVEFSGKLWRIISIDNDGYIKIIQDDTTDYSVWDNRYNDDYGYVIGINNFEGIEASRLKNNILSAYNDESIVSSKAKALIVPREYCVGKRSAEDISKDGSTECAVKSELMGATTLSVYEYLTASLDGNCTSTLSRSCANYNYLAELGADYWTTTAQVENTGYAYLISGTVDTSQTSMSYSLNLVVTVNGNINYVSGDGTVNNPYIIK